MKANYPADELLAFDQGDPFQCGQRVVDATLELCEGFPYVYGNLLIAAQISAGQNEPEEPDVLHRIRLFTSFVMGANLCFGIHRFRQEQFRNPGNAEVQEAIKKMVSSPAGCDDFMLQELEVMARLSALTQDSESDFHLTIEATLGFIFMMKLLPYFRLPRIDRASVHQGSVGSDG